MHRLPTSKRLLTIAIAMTVLGMLTLTVVIAFGGLDRLSQVGRVRSVPALLAVWTWGTIALLVLGCLRSRPRPAQILTAVVSVLVCLALIEVGGRILGLPRPVMRGLRSADLHHVLPPLRDMVHRPFDGASVLVSTNEDGLRTPYSRREFLRHRTRIAVLGDSFTFGWGVAGEQAFPARLEARIRSEDPELDVAVLNAGIISYSPFLQRRQLDQVVSAYEPTLVLLTFDMSDVGDDEYYRRRLEPGSRDGDFAFPDSAEEPESPTTGVVERVFLAPVLRGLRYPFEVIGNRLAGADRDAKGRRDGNPYYDFELEIDGVHETNRFFIYRHPLEATRPYFEATLANIVDTARIAGDGGASFVLIVPPRFQHWNPKEAPHNWEFCDYALEEPFPFEYRRFFQEARDRVDFAIIDLLPDFQATREYPLVFREDPHWNASGHDFVAHALLRHLRKLGLVPK